MAEVVCTNRRRAQETGTPDHRMQHVLSLTSVMACGVMGPPMEQGKLTNVSSAFHLSAEELDPTLLVSTAACGLYVLFSPLTCILGRGNILRLR